MRHVFHRCTVWSFVGHLQRDLDGFVAFPRLQNRETFTPRTWTCPHPSDEDLSPGTPGVRGDPDMGHPELEVIEAEAG